MIQKALIQAETQIVFQLGSEGKGFDKKGKGNNYMEKGMNFCWS